ncbi:MAG: hypothetical protein ABIH26_09990 [Candidatus Eisenbacteria bacterium]
MKQRKRQILFAFAGALPAILLLWAASATNPAARAPVSDLYLELLVTKGAPSGYDLPPDCSVWKQIYPNPALQHHQDAIEDNGDTLLSACDFIHLDGSRYHITWVGPTYWVKRLAEAAAFEPEKEPTGKNPTCETWHEVYPQFCTPHHIEEWEDNGDGFLSPCDVVVMDGIACHIEKIELNIIVEPAPSATEEESWGRIKSLFRR